MATSAATGRRVRARAPVDSDGLIAAARQRTAKRLAGREFRTSLVLGVAFLAVALPFALLAPTGRDASLPLALLLAAAYALASRVVFEVGIGIAVPTQLVFVPMLFLLPPAWAPLLVVAGFTAARLPAYVTGKTPPGRALLNLANGWYAIGPAAVLVLAGEPDPDWRARWPVFVAALAAQFGFDFAVAAVRGLALGVSPRAHLPEMRWPYLVDAALAPLGLVLAFVSLQRPFALVLALPLLGLLAFFATERRARVDHALELSRAYRGTALLLGDVIEADDEYTGSHSRDVVSLVLAVADDLGLAPGERRDAEFAALLHDVGKIRIPSELINKPGPLTAEERAIVETHTVEGERLLERVGGLLGEVGQIVRSCHERWDGAGYPDRLAGDAIPLVARIVCCCDAFNAMTTDRPYRRALPLAEAIAEVERNAGVQFDPDVAAALVRVVTR